MPAEQARRALLSTSHTIAANMSFPSYFASRPRCPTDCALESSAMTRPATLVLSLLLPFSAPQGHAQSPTPQSFTLPPGTPLPVHITTALPMKAGEPIRAELLYPVYDHDQLIFPASPIVPGTFLSLAPDRSRRLHARLRGDFPPFHIPVVRFTNILLA